MNKCTETKEGWPDALGDVPLDAYDAFLAHVARCPFHTKALQADADNIRSIFRRARGLNAHGRILVGRELRQKVAEQDRRHALWKVVAQESNLPLRRIYLCNRGEDIAGSGKFLGFRDYDGHHQLDAAAGLQIVGVVGEGKSPLEVLLGWYALKGVKHTGEEQFLPLDNGYTVGLRVKQLSDREFNIGFRCVDSEALEAERTGIMLPGTQGMSVHNSAMLLRVQSLVRVLRTSLSPRRLISFFRSEPATAIDKLEWCAACVVIFSICLTGILWWDYIQARVFANGFEKTPVTVTDSKPARGNDQSTPPVAAQTKAPPGKTQKRSDGGGADPVLRQVSSDESVTQPGNKPPVPESKAEPHTDEVNVQPGTWHFQSQPSKAGAEEGIAINSGFDEDLMKKLTAEMRKQRITVKRFNRRSRKDHQVAVAWNIIREKTVVTVEATLTAGGDSKFLSFSSAGSCQKQACKDAVRRAVSKVSTEIKDVTHNESTDSVSEN